MIRRGIEVGREHEKRGKEGIRLGSFRVRLELLLLGGQRLLMRP